MKTKDIEIGGVYAVAEQHEWKPGRWDGDRGQVATKAEVLETGTTRRFSSTKDGVRMRVLDDHTYRYAEGQIITMRAAEVREKWEDFQPRRDAAAAARQEALDNAERAALKIIERIKAALPDGFNVEDITPQKRHSGVYPTSTTITYARLAKVLESAKQGRE